MKFTSVCFLLVSFCLLIGSGPALAHHGFAGRYDEANPVTVTGTVVEFQFMNPHSQITFDARDEKGNVQRWEAELGSAGQLHRAEGWDKDTLRPGDKVTISGPRAKNGANDMNLSHQSRIVMTDSGKEIHNSYEKADQ
jgi:hypothetical protein